MQFACDSGGEERPDGTRISYITYQRPGGSQGTEQADYIFLNGSIFAKASENDIYFYHNDHLGSPQKMTDMVRQVVWTGDFKPFGEAINVTGAITNNFRFPGQYYDHSTGLNYNYFRDYNAAIGRYLETDPIGLSGGLNLYVYVHNNPLMRQDRYGLTDRYSFCDNATPALKCVCKEITDQVCKFAPSLCCEFEKTGCMGDVSLDDPAYEPKAFKCYYEYTKCMFKAGKPPKTREELKIPPGLDRYPAPPGRGNPNRPYGDW